MSLPNNAPSRNNEKYLARKPLKAGMVLAIEPMVTMGTWEVRVLEDRWTAVTQDGSWAAHFEDTIAITDNGPEILTRVE